MRCHSSSFFFIKVPVQPCCNTSFTLLLTTNTICIILSQNYILTSKQSIYHTYYHYTKDKQYNLFIYCFMQRNPTIYLWLSHTQTQFPIGQVLYVVLLLQRLTVTTCTTTASTSLIVYTCPLLCNGHVADMFCNIGKWLFNHLAATYHQ